MKTLFTLLFFCCIHGVFAQMQHISISGKLQDTRQQPLTGAEVCILFNNNTIALDQVDEYGDYLLDIHYYGNIYHVDLIIIYNGQCIRNIKKINLMDGKARVNITLDGDLPNNQECAQLTENGKPTPWERRLWGIMNADHFRAYDHMPIFYHKKVSYQFMILDEYRQPIKNAYVAVMVPDDKPRWGRTDENGHLILHMEFEKGALDGKILIAAEGYKTRRLLFQKFRPNNSYFYTLKAKNA